MVADGYAQDAAVVDGGLTEDIVELPPVAVGETDVRGASYLGVDQRTDAIRVYDVGAQLFSFDDGDGFVAASSLSASE